jgi:hypothetical protein
VGLVARALEEAGVPTICLTAAYGDGGDDRRQRVDTPQYQYESDRLAAGG